MRAKPTVVEPLRTSQVESIRLDFCAVEVSPNLVGYFDALHPDPNTFELSDEVVR